MTKEVVAIIHDKETIVVVHASLNSEAIEAVKRYYGNVHIVSVQTIEA